MISRFFIERPILANVIAIVTIILGVVAVLGLPVAQYPEITPPTVQVTTTYPGASARVVADTVALPIEQQVNGVRGHALHAVDERQRRHLQARSSPSRSAPTWTWPRSWSRTASRPPSPQLPQDVQKQGAVTKKVSTAILQVIALYSPDGRYDSLFLSNYASINLRDELARLPGVGDVNVFGVGQYSMRVWLDPEMLKTFSLDPSDVVSAIQQQNLQVPAGQIGMPPAPAGQNFQFPVNVAGRLDEIEQFENIIVKIATGQGSRIIRVKDVGPRRAGRPDLQPVLQLRRPSPARVSPSSSCPAPTPWRWPTRSQGHGRAQQELPPGPELRHPLRHDRSSPGPPSTRSTRPCTRPASWCCSSSWSSCRTGAPRWCRPPPCR